MEMDGLQVSEIKFALRDTLPASLHSQPSFDFVQLRWINDLEAIFKGPRAGINVRIASVTHLAAALACSRM
jgi:hypothetical protein